TITQPWRSTASAVVSPTPPGQRPGSVDVETRAKTLRRPPGETCTMVVPVPCRFARLLKLLTRTSPATSRPVDRFTTTVPYGLTSPLAGTVDATTLRWWNRPRNPAAAPLAPAAPTTSSRTAAVTAAIDTRLIALPL